ncbi:MAG: hypothetical protein V7K14_03800 [Nostoc sp.]|uniref:hypothetical protein n=1 Tax=Nostoc sp. TaxID=1180 RepID=UPI002FF4774D
MGTVKPQDANIGDYVTITDLIACGATFYTMDGKPCADTAFHGYMLENASDPGFKRIG